MESTPLDDSEPATATDLFRLATTGVIPLTAATIAPFRRPRAPYPLPTTAQRSNGDDDNTPIDTTIRPEDRLEFARPGVQLRLLQDLQRGALLPQRDLDLHGLTVEYAAEILEAFLTDCQQRGLRCIRIIHGKGYRSHQGQPILKQWVNTRLRQREAVLAFCSTQPRDGGGGAVYVWLRNSRKGWR